MNASQSTQQNVWPPLPMIQQQELQSQGQQGHSFQPMTGNETVADTLNSSFTPMQSHAEPYASTDASSLEILKTTSNASAGPLFPQFSPSTEEILKRLNANSMQTVSDGWESAREQVLRSMVTSDTLTASATAVERARGGGRSVARIASAPGSASALNTHESAIGAMTSRVFVNTSLTPNATRAPSGGRGRGVRTRGRGGGRWKRKRADSEDDDTDISTTYTPMPTKTKSGRNINKPMPFTPAFPSPSSTHKRRRSYRRESEASVCKECLRGHSPPGNMIVFCDGCNIAYHQFCHDPPIDKEVVQVVEKEWFCSRCETSKESPASQLQSLVSGEDMSDTEKRAYLSVLPHSTLTSLLIHACNLHPDLPIFRPQSRSHFSTPPLPNDMQASINTQQPVPGTSFPPKPSQDSLQGEVHSGSAFKYPSHTSKLTMPIAADPQSNQNPTSSLGNNDETFDPYDEDPPEHYPKAGNGFARTLRPEGEDLQWLVDDNFEVFSHTYPSKLIGGGGFNETEKGIEE